MAKRSIFNTVSQRIESAPYGSVFCITDFLDLAEQKTISKCLLRLEGQNTIRKIWNGIFYKPTLNNQEPTLREAVKALARSNGWRVVPTDDTALYYIGFQKDAPEEWHFISNGSNRDYSYQGKKIVLTHAAGRFVSLLSAETATWVQALKSITQEKLTAPLIEKLRTLISPETKQKLIAELRLCPAWIASVLVVLCSSAVINK